MTNQQGAPEALRLADEWQRKTQREADRQNSAYDRYGMGNTPETVDPLGAKMAAELRRLAALVEAQQPAPSAAAECGRCVGTGRIDTCKGAPGHEVYADCPDCQPSPTPQAESQPAPVLDSLLNIVINHEARATPEEVRSMAAELATYRAARAPADSVTAPAGGGVAGMNEYGVRGYLAATLKCWHRLTGDEAAELVAMTQRLSGLYLCPAHQDGMTGWKWVPVEPTEEMLAAAHDGDREYTLRNFGDVMTVMQGPYDHWAAMIDAAPIPPAKAADSVLEDAARLDHLQRTGSTVEVLPGVEFGDAWRYRVGGLHKAVSHDLRAAIDAARKQGANHD